MSTCSIETLSFGLNFLGAAFPTALRQSLEPTGSLSAGMSDWRLHPRLGEGNVMAMSGSPVTLWHTLRLAALATPLMWAPLSASTVPLGDIDSGTTSPTGTYRWLDVANNEYGALYQGAYDYTQATVAVDFSDAATRFQGTLAAANLKPNFAYQIKLVGEHWTVANEMIGLTGRWWQEEWINDDWGGGANLNDRDDGSSPNPNDLVYTSRHDIPATDPDNKSGFHYRYTGYLLLDYFVTDENGAAAVPFVADSSYHVLWKTSQLDRTAADGPIVSAALDPGATSYGYDTDYPASSADIYGEWERLPVGGVTLPTGDYAAQIILTEESFHGSGGALAGNWAAAVGGDIGFTIIPEPASATLLACALLVGLRRRPRC